MGKLHNLEAFDARKSKQNSQNSANITYT